MRTISVRGVPKGTFSQHAPLVPKKGDKDRTSQSRPPVGLRTSWPVDMMASGGKANAPSDWSDFWN